MRRSSAVSVAGKDGDGHLLHLSPCSPCLGTPRVHAPHGSRPKQVALLLAWHGWLPGLSVLVSETLGLRLLVSWRGGRWSRFWDYPVDDSCFWTPPDFWDADILAAEIGEHPCVWTDGIREACTTGF